MSTAGKTVLLTGATGFLGSNLARKLLREGFKVAILKRSFSNTQRIDDIAKRLIQYDIDQNPLEKPFQELEEIDYVIHTATCYGRSGEKRSDILETNTFFPLKLMDLVCKFNVTCFFNTDTVLTKYLNDYAFTKAHFREWGEYLSKKSFNLKFVNIRLEHIFGECDDVNKFVPYIITSCLNNNPEIKLTLGEQKRDFIYIDDVVDGYIHLINNLSKISESYQDIDLGSGKSVSIRSLVEMIHNITASQTDLVFGGIPYRQDEVMYSEANLQCMSDLNWKPQYTLEEGIDKTISWYLRNKNQILDK